MRWAKGGQLVNFYIWYFTVIIITLVFTSFIMNTKYEPVGGQSFSFTRLQSLPWHTHPQRSLLSLSPHSKLPTFFKIQTFLDVGRKNSEPVKAKENPQQVQYADWIEKILETSDQNSDCSSTLSENHQVLDIFTLLPSLNKSVSPVTPTPKFLPNPLRRKEWIKYSQLLKVSMEISSVIEGTISHNSSKTSEVESQE